MMPFSLPVTELQPPASTTGVAPHIVEWASGDDGGTEFVDTSREPQRSLDYRAHMNPEGSPTRTVAAGYQWMPSGELARRVA